MNRLLGRFLCIYVVIATKPILFTVRSVLK